MGEGEGFIGLYKRKIERRNREKEKEFWGWKERYKKRWQEGRKEGERERGRQHMRVNELKGRSDQLTFTVSWFVFRTQPAFKGIVHLEINFWYVLPYLKDIQDVGVFVSTLFLILTFFGQTGLVYQSYNGVLGGPPQRACTKKWKWNMI